MFMKFPIHLNLDRCHEIVFDYRGCIGNFDVQDIITECVVIPGEVNSSVESTIQSYKLANHTKKPIFVVRFHLAEEGEILPLSASLRKRMARGNMDVLSEKGVNIKGKDTSAAKELKSPNQVSRRRLTKEEIAKNILEDAKENITVTDSLVNSVPSGSSSSIGKVSRVRRSLVSDLDGPPEKQSRNEVQENDSQKSDLHFKLNDSNAVGAESKVSWVSELLDVNEPVVDNGGRCVTPIRLSLKRVWLDSTPSKVPSCALEVFWLSGANRTRSPPPNERVRRSTRKNKCNVSLAENIDSDSDSLIKSRSSKKSDEKSLNENPRSRAAPCDDSNSDTVSMESEPIFDLKSQNESVRSQTSRVLRKSGRTQRKSYKEQEDSEFCLSPEFLISSKSKVSSDNSPIKPRTPRSRRTSSRFKDVDTLMSPEESNITLTSRTPNKTEKTPQKTPQRTSRKTSNKTEKTPQKTPRKTPTKSPKTPKTKTPSGTSSSKGCYAPSMPVRASAPLTPMSSLEQVRKNLHVSAVPMSLPCREAEYRNIYHFLENKIRDNSGGCMYISGVPGTGKTATVNAVVRSLKHEVELKKLRDFQYIEVNGLRMTEPRQVFVQVLKSLTGQKRTPQQAQDILAQRFCSGSAKNKTVVLLVDEVDMLRNRRQDVIYNLFDWPSKSNSHFIVLTIANTMDLPERLLKGRVTSRLGLTRLTFQPYSYKQLQEIVMSRIAGSNSFNDDAVELVARKVAACSGDVRRALDICRRASELVEEGSPVTMPIINKVLSNMMNSANVCSIKACSRLEKLFLQAVVAENERTGVEETMLISVYRQFQSLCALAGVSLINISEAMALLNRLGTSGLLLTEHSRGDINQSIFLNVNADDIHYALSQTST
ncbi:Origin recognition complex subunit 1 [Frankliniella fusca]|uniref:Origin recognition complex subunit 1 n=1 Tax=Frankliniella fusca TaxID=407009 RepID=A0AAE1HDK9_9NEOP|nr:Origin recognition complex subunit 1 [Frankliniella fusca]